MRLALLATFTVSALVTPLVACGGDDGGPITDPGTWLDTYVGRLCAKAHACKADFPPAQGDFATSWGADVTACKATFLTPERVRASVTGGKATFDPAKGDQCLSMLPYDSQDCPAFWAGSDPDICGTVFAGTVAANGACANGLECMTGLACASGTCMPQGVTGPAAGRSNLNAALAGN